MESKNKVSSLEEQIKKLENELKLAKMEEMTKSLNDLKDEISSKYNNFSRQDMELIYQLLFGHFIINEFDQTFLIDHDIYINKVAEIMDMWPEEVRRDFGELFQKYEELENTFDDDMIIDYLNEYINKAKILEDEDPDNLITIFIKD